MAPVSTEINAKFPKKHAPFEIWSKLRLNQSTFLENIDIRETDINVIFTVNLETDLNMSTHKSWFFLSVS